MIVLCGGTSLSAFQPAQDHQLPMRLKHHVHRRQEVPFGRKGAQVALNALTVAFASATKVCIAASRERETERFARGTRCRGVGREQLARASRVAVYEFGRCQ